MVGELPIDRMYEAGVDIDFGDALYEQLGDTWHPTAVDWGQEVSLPYERRRMAAFLATEFHYDNMFELALCGRFLGREWDAEGKVLAVVLANARVRNAAAWARYIEKIGETVDLSHAKREYFGDLYEEDWIPVMVLGISVIGDVSWYAFMDKVDDVGGQLFRDVVSSIREQKRGHIDQTANYLQDKIENMPDEERQRFAEQAAIYRDRMTDIIASHEEKLARVDKDPDAVLTHVETYIDSFYSLTDIDEYH